MLITIMRPHGRALVSREVDPQSRRKCARLAGGNGVREENSGQTAGHHEQWKPPSALRRQQQRAEKPFAAPSRRENCTVTNSFN